MSGMFTPRSAAERRKKHGLVDVELDGSQREAVALPEGRALLVLGEAGHGKTTVLLHRLARLYRPSKRAAVLVPTEGLVRLLQPLLRRLGVDVEVRTFDRFAGEQARRAFRRLPRESDGAVAAVMGVKRSPALLPALEAIAARTRGRATREDLLHLFGDRALLETLGLPALAIDATLEHTRVQFSRTTEREWSHVTDRARLVAVDRRALDEGTATADATTIDVEDYAVLFAIDRLRGKPVAPRAFDLIAIDEAQELAPLELELIGRSLAPGGTLVVAGDADQQTDETSTFAGWEAVMRMLGASEHATTVLDIGYRCPPRVVAIARAVRDGGRGVAPVLVFEDERALARELGGAIEALRARDARASIGIVCRRPMTARRLAPLVPARLVFDGRFLARGPAQATIVSEVKGLELDYVVVPDATAADWPDDAASRRALYVATTRARHEVVFARVANASPTPLLVQSSGGTTES